MASMFFNQKFVATVLVSAVLTACGGGDEWESPRAVLTDETVLLDENGTPMAQEAATTASRERAQGLANVTQTTVYFNSADATANTPATAIRGVLFRDPTATSKNAAVVLMHGCAGVWSNSKPDTNTPSHIHLRWGRKLATEGYTVLVVDSFTDRHVANQCNQNVVKYPSNWAPAVAKVDEVTVRPKDALGARSYLIDNAYAASNNIAVIGWSNGATAVLSLMETSQKQGAAVNPFREAFAYYPGCGMGNTYGSPSQSTWLPYAPVTIYHASKDDLYNDGFCTQRINRAINLGASAQTGNAVAMIVKDGARHSFDQIDVGKTLAQINQNISNTADQYTQDDIDAQNETDPLVLQRLNALF